MGDSLVLETGKLWGGASWLVRKVLAAIADVIREQGVNERFAVWLLDCSQRSAGLAGFDLRGLPEVDREVFFDAASIALQKARTQSDECWSTPGAFDGYIEAFTLLTQNRGCPWFHGTLEWDGELIDFDDLWTCQ